MNLQELTDEEFFGDKKKNIEGLYFQVIKERSRRLMKQLIQKVYCK